MTNKIIYSLKVNIGLQQKGFKPIAQLPNPKKPEFMCWVYEWNDKIQECFLDLVAGGKE